MVLDVIRRLSRAVTPVCADMTFSCRDPSLGSRRRTSTYGTCLLNYRSGHFTRIMIRDVVACKILNLIQFVLYFNSYKFSYLFTVNHVSLSTVEIDQGFVKLVEILFRT